MPIKGLSTREDTAPRFKVLGKLRKGTKKKANGQMGDDLKDYFRFTSDDPDVVVAFYDIFKDKPNHLPCYLPFDQMEDNFSSWRELYGQNGLVKRRCDGEHWKNWIDGARYMRGHKLCELECKDTPNKCPDCPLKAVGRLTIILPDLWRAGYIGLVTVETHAFNDIGFLSGKLVQHEPLTGKEFTLYRETKKIGVPDQKNGRRFAVAKSLVFVELSQRWLLKELEAAESAAFARLEPGRPALPMRAEPDIDFSAVAGLEKPGEPIFVEPEEGTPIEGVVVEPEDQEPPEADPDATPEDVSDLPPCPPWPKKPVLSNGSFFAAVQKTMSYENIGAVKMALHSILGKGTRWEEAGREGYWEDLWVHRHAMDGE